MARPEKQEAARVAGYDLPPLEQAIYAAAWGAAFANTFAKQWNAGPGGELAAGIATHVADRIAKEAVECFRCLRDPPPALEQAGETIGGKR